MKASDTKRITRPLAGLLVVMVTAISPAGAAITFDFTSGSNTSSPDSLTVSSLVDGTPTDSSGGSGLEDNVSVTGSLTGLTDNTDGFDMDLQVWTTASVSGNDVTLTTVNSEFAVNSDGFAPSNGLFKGDTSQGMSIVFDLTNFATNTILRLTDFNATQVTGTSAANALLVIDGVSSTDLGGVDGSGLSIDISDGSMLFIKNNSGELAGNDGNNRFRITTMTFEAVAIPEPSSFALLSLSGLALFRRRR
ncbi:PEP-CTERM sorting domain-containing protein [Haloferula sp. A504]|uniref:PEP-CTERM sorting domain-containing protein n=1 Tax=Haloferula sp. A504 TaxID=3373601 RepID=UPI0031BCD65D|nr:PEP-CTERM sorting domain-containing protein [Verrucomicrobiaceae bacterium E54]